MTTPTAEMIGTSAYSFVSPLCHVVRTEICGRVIQFTITDRKDVIQKSHAKGVFYEPEEMAIIGQWFRAGSVFCDIGANIGNHTIFAMKILQAARSIVFEPNPDAIAVLKSNIHLNGLRSLVDTSFLGVGLSDRAAEGLSMVVPPRNLGAGRIQEGDGDIRTILGDDALDGKQVDFIKIDVEGMELRALAGLSATIRRCRPRLFIEVDNVNNADFMTWAASNGYAVKASYRRYPSNINYLICPEAS